MSPTPEQAPEATVQATIDKTTLAFNAMCSTWLLALRGAEEPGTPTAQDIATHARDGLGLTYEAAAALMTASQRTARYMHVMTASLARAGGKAETISKLLLSLWIDLMDADDDEARERLGIDPEPQAVASQDETPARKG